MKKFGKVVYSVCEEHAARKRKGMTQEKHNFFMILHTVYTTHIRTFIAVTGHMTVLTVETQELRTSEIRTDQWPHSTTTHI